jgi:hypothetical protein
MRIKGLLSAAFALLLSGCAGGGALGQPEPSARSVTTQSQAANGCQPNCGEDGRCGEQDGCGGRCIGSCGKPGYVCTEEDDEPGAPLFVCRDAKQLFGLQ